MFLKYVSKIIDDIFYERQYVYFLQTKILLKMRVRK